MYVVIIFEKLYILSIYKITSGKSFNHLITVLIFIAYEKEFP